MTAPTTSPKRDCRWYVWVIEDKTGSPTIEACACCHRILNGHDFCLNCPDYEPKEEKDA